MKTRIEKRRAETIVKGMVLYFGRHTPKWVVGCTQQSGKQSVTIYCSEGGDLTRGITGFQYRRSTLVPVEISYS